MMTFRKFSSLQAFVFLLSVCALSSAYQTVLYASESTCDYFFSGKLKLYPADSFRNAPEILFHEGLMEENIGDARKTYSFERLGECKARIKSYDDEKTVIVKLAKKKEPLFLKGRFLESGQLHREAGTKVKNVNCESFKYGKFRMSDNNGSESLKDLNLLKLSLRKAEFDSISGNVSFSRTETDACSVILSTSKPSEKYPDKDYLLEILNPGETRADYELYSVSVFKAVKISSD